MPGMRLHPKSRIELRRVKNVKIGACTVMSQSLVAYTVLTVFDWCGKDAKVCRNGM